MKAWLTVVLLCSAVLPAALLAFQGLPRCTAVDPDTAKTGDTVTATCDNADKGSFAEMYLTNGKDDTKVAVMEQGSGKIKFQVPRLSRAGITSSFSRRIKRPWWSSRWRSPCSNRTLLLSPRVSTRVPAHAEPDLPPASLRHSTRSSYRPNCAGENRRRMRHGAQSAAMDVDTSTCQSYIILVAMRIFSAPERVAR